MERIAVVTGSGQGIGREIALAFADAGYDLVLAARGVANLNETAQLVNAKGLEAHVVPTDLTEEADAASLADTVRKIGPSAWPKGLRGGLAHAAVATTSTMARSTLPPLTRPAL